MAAASTTPSKLRLLAIVQSRADDSESTGCRGEESAPEPATLAEEEEEEDESAHGDAEDSDPLVPEVNTSRPTPPELVGASPVEEGTVLPDPCPEEEKQGEEAGAAGPTDQGLERLERASKSRPRRRSASLKASEQRVTASRPAPKAMWATVQLQDHPLWTMEMNQENGKSWLNNPFAADLCLMVGRRYFFIHRPLVADWSDYLCSLLDPTPGFESPGFTLHLPVADPDALEGLLRWMYTGDPEVLSSDKIFGLIPVADYLGMRKPFWEELYKAVADMWEASGSETWLASFTKHIERVPVSCSLEIVHRCGATKRSIPPDLLLSLLLQVADARQNGDECKPLAEPVNKAVPLCKHETIQMMAEKYTSSFDALVRPSKLCIRQGQKRKAFHRVCSRCHLNFANGEEAAAAPCRETVLTHSEDTFHSKAGNLCCCRCRKPLSQYDPRCSQLVTRSFHNLVDWTER
ncbi:unnamed protein product [Symbiodinium natans]|uniref:BTB domain-containing protein n=1 Tax=Symbiodinium natans TaxID=878477 RepID=A0A812LKW2_9DINO|nr:unnamed protein product [Symbiodinium natans]